MASRSPYDLLGISQDADPAQIRSAFLQRVKVLHPDRFDKASQPDEWNMANEMLRELNEAYAMVLQINAQIPEVEPCAFHEEDSTSYDREEEFNRQTEEYRRQTEEHRQSMDRMDKEHLKKMNDAKAKHDAEEHRVNLRISGIAMIIVGFVAIYMCNDSAKDVYGDGRPVADLNDLAWEKWGAKILVFVGCIRSIVSFFVGKSVASTSNTEMVKTPEEKLLEERLREFYFPFKLGLYLIFIGIAIVVILSWIGDLDHLPQGQWCWQKVVAWTGLSIIGFGLLSIYVWLRGPSNH